MGTSTYNQNFTLLVIVTNITQNAKKSQSKTVIYGIQRLSINWVTQSFLCALECFKKHNYSPLRIQGVMLINRKFWVNHIYKQYILYEVYKINNFSSYRWLGYRCDHFQLQVYGNISSLQYINCYSKIHPRLCTNVILLTRAETYIGVI